MDDPYNLDRFVTAQAGLFDRVMVELRAGRKRSHWMWFIFPQISGLGFSAMAQLYAIGSREEAMAYLRHPVLGARLLECTGLVNAIEGASATEIFGSPDDVKFRSSMTLFGQVAPAELSFARALDKYFGGEPDTRTLDLLRREGGQA